MLAMRLVSAVAALVVFALLAFAGMFGAIDEEEAEAAEVGGCGAVTGDAQVGGSNERPGEPGEPAGGVTQRTPTLGADQMASARTIAGIGKGMGVKERGVAIALATAMQESQMGRQMSSPTGVSNGLFHQGGEYYAGVDKSSARATSKAFYKMLLKRVPDYTSARKWPIHLAAQEVQRSGAGAQEYAKWEAWAEKLASKLYTGADSTGGGDSVEIECSAGGGSGPIGVELNGVKVILPADAKFRGTLSFPNSQAAKAAAAALSYLGTPYAWGGGGPNGPGKGIRDGGVADAHGDYNKTGFDCSGLTEYAWAQAGEQVGGDSRSQRAGGGPVHPWNKARPGDLLFWGSGAVGSIHHVAIYLGKVDGKHLMVEAPQSGDVVKVSEVRTGGDFRNETVRPWEKG